MFLSPNRFVLENLNCASSSATQRSTKLIPSQFSFLNDQYSHNVQKRVVGPGERKTPVLYLINQDYEYSESIPLHLLTRKECNNLMKALGFYNYKDVVPENKQTGPYVRDEAEMTKMYSVIEEKEMEAAEALQREKEEAERKKREEDEKEAETCGLDEDVKEKRDDASAEETENDGDTAHDPENEYTEKQNEPVKDDL